MNYHISKLNFEVKINIIARDIKNKMLLREMESVIIKGKGKYVSSLKDRNEELIEAKQEVKSLNT